MSKLVSLLEQEVEAVEAEAKPANIYDNPIPAEITQYLVANQTPQKALVYLQYLMYIIYEKCSVEDAIKILKTMNTNLEILNIFNLDNIDEIYDMVAFYSPNASIPRIPVLTIKTFIREYNKAVGINKTELHLDHTPYYTKIYIGQLAAR